MNDKTFRPLALITVIAFLIGACGGEQPTPTPPPAVTPTAIPTAAPLIATATEAGGSESAATPEAQATTLLTATVAATTTVPATAAVTMTETAMTTATEVLENLTYQSEYTKDGTAPLAGGQYREQAAPGSATETVVTLTNQRAIGELNGAPAAAVVLVSEPGGSGAFYDLAVVAEQDGEWTNVATTLLGDRVQVNSVAIADNQITVEMVTQGPNDPLCCPTQQVVQSYTVEGEQLVLASSEVVGTVEATTPLTTTQATTASAPAEVTAAPPLTVTATVTASSATTASDAAGEASQLTVVSVRTTSEIVNEKAAAGATVSPDGANLAWIQSSGRARNRVRQLCLFTVVEK